MATVAHFAAPRRSTTRGRPRASAAGGCRPSREEEFPGCDGARSGGPCSVLVEAPPRPRAHPPGPYHPVALPRESATAPLGGGALGGGRVGGGKGYRRRCLSWRALVTTAGFASESWSEQSLGEVRGIAVSAYSRPPQREGGAGGSRGGLLYITQGITLTRVGRMGLAWRVGRAWPEG